MTFALQRYSDFSTPVVPPDYIQYVCGHDNFDDFLRSGAEVALQLELALKKYFDKSFNNFDSILDFGCGVGRLLRFIESRHVISACDIHAGLVEYCKSAYANAEVYRNELLPPLEYKSDSFDLIYSFSVFSHLSQSVENVWLAELARVGRPGCTYLLTIHGDWVIEATLGKEAAAAKSQGFYYKKVHDGSGGANAFPDYYQASYHTSDYIRRNWSTVFDIVAVINGDAPDNYLSDGMAWAPAGNVPMFRPMGQDLVVAIKK